MVVWDAWVNAYYNFTYKWVADSLSDVPPGVGSTPGAYGYALRTGSVSTYLSGGGPVTGATTYQAWYNLLPTHSATYVSPSGGYYMGGALNIPAPGASPTITVGGVTYYVAMGALGGGTVTINGSGDHVISFPVLNSQRGLWNSNFTSIGPSGGGMLFQAANLTEFIGVATIGDIPVKETTGGGGGTTGGSGGGTTASGGSTGGTTATGSTTGTSAGATTGGIGDFAAMSSSPRSGSSKPNDWFIPLLIPAIGAFAYRQRNRKSKNLA